jgi:hypothetical protein
MRSLFQGENSKSKTWIFPGEGKLFVGRENHGFQEIEKMENRDRTGFQKSQYLALKQTEAAVVAVSSSTFE